MKTVHQTGRASGLSAPPILVASSVGAGLTGPAWAHRLPVGLLLVLVLVSGSTAFTADSIFSGPQRGEKTTAFDVVELTGTNVGRVRDPITENAGAATAIVFVHGIERSLVPLLRVVDQYGGDHRESLRTDIVFLSPDRLQGERHVKAAANSLKLQSRVGLSVDGPEGPGNYGLNKECLMTIVAARSNLVTANFALVQPGVADAPLVLAALAAICGDTNPPTAAQLLERQAARAGPAGGRGAAMNMNQDGTKAKDPFPGAVPTDAKLQGLLRQFIRPTNDNATVDRVLAEVKTHIQDKAELRQQAVDGWTRVLHFGDRYGTPYGRTKGREFLEQLKTQGK